MARRLHEMGHPIVAVADARRALAKKLASELGTKAPATLAEITASADVVFTVVTDDRAQAEVFRKSGDSLLVAAKGTTFINCATVSPSVHEECARRCEAAGASCLEACMASSVTQARDGTLYLMCGGRPETFNRLRPLLATLSNNGKLLRHIGPSGSAARLKALVNMVMNIHTAALAEGLGLGAALGLDPATVAEVFAETGAASRVLATDGRDMIERDHECYFSAAHAAKDSGIALKLAKSARVPTPLAAATLRQYRRLVALGLGHLDKSSVAELTFPGRTALAARHHPR